MSSTNGEPVTLERILDRENLGRAYRQVVANKGAPGVDGMKVSELADYCRAHPNEISQAVLNGKYRPRQTDLYSRRLHRYCRTFTSRTSRTTASASDRGADAGKPSSEPRNTQTADARG